MGSALFYHLTRSPAAALVPSLVGKARQAGWRVELRGTDPAAMASLDERMWQGEGFLPHGLAGGPHDALQPVLLTVAEVQASGAPAAPLAGGADGGGFGCLIAIDGAPVSAADCTATQRCCIVFDGNDPEALDRARGQWRALTAAGVVAEYWSEAGGRWEKKA